jgi:hypothetical protein
VARRAALQRFHAHVFHQFLAFDRLQIRGFNTVRAPRPAEVGDFISRTNVVGGRAMAIKAETHAQWFCVINRVHFINASVTFHATDATRDVNGVIEINVIRRDVNLRPCNRRVVRRAVANNFQSRVVFQNRAVTIHAGRSGGNICDPCFVHHVVAITAIEAEVARMNFVRERNRLRRLIADSRVFGSEVKRDRGRHYAARNREHDDDPQRQPICPLRKNRWHFEAATRQIRQLKIRLVYNLRNRPPIII